MTPGSTKPAMFILKHLFIQVQRAAGNKCKQILILEQTAI